MHILFVFQNIDIAKDYTITSHTVDLPHSNGEAHRQPDESKQKLS
jgi:hypothetical protein